MKIQVFLISSFVVFCGFIGIVIFISCAYPNYEINNTCSSSITNEKENNNDDIFSIKIVNGWTKKYIIDNNLFSKHNCPSISSFNYSIIYNSKIMGYISNTNQLYIIQDCNNILFYIENNIIYSPELINLGKITKYNNTIFIEDNIKYVAINKNNDGYYVSIFNSSAIVDIGIIFFAIINDNNNFDTCNSLFLSSIVIVIVLFICMCMVTFLMFMKHRNIMKKFLILNNNEEGDYHKLQNITNIK